MKTLATIQIYFFVLAWFSFSPTQAEIIERIVATVNSEVILLSDLKSYKAKLQKGGLVDDSLLKLKDSKKILSNDKDLIKHLVDEKVMDSEIKKLNIQVTIEQVEKEINDKNRESKLFVHFKA